MKNLIKVTTVSAVALTMILGSMSSALAGPKFRRNNTQTASINKYVAPKASPRHMARRTRGYTPIGKTSTGPTMPVSPTPNPPQDDVKPVHFMGAAFAIISAGVSIGVLAHKVANPDWETDGGSLADTDEPQGGGGSLGGAGSGLQYD